MAAKQTPRKSTGARGGNGRPLAKTDNRTPEEIEADRRKLEDDRHKAEALQLISIVAQARAAERAVANAKAPFDAAKKAYNDVMGLAKQQGFKRYEIEDILKDSGAANRLEVEDKEVRRQRFRLAMGLPAGVSGQEQELTDRLPDVERNGLFWVGAGFSDGLSGADFAPPAACVAAGHDNRYREGYEGGQTKLQVTQMELKKAKEPPPPADPLDDPHSPESLRRDAGSVERAKASLKAMGTGVPQGEDFEASPEELAAQAARPSVVDAQADVVEEDV